MPNGILNPRNTGPRRYGWRPDLPDHRDIHYAAPPAHIAALPPSVDLRVGLGPCYDQGQLGSCTGNAIAAAVEFDLRKQYAGPVPAQQPFIPSRLFIYYNERLVENTINEDAGAVIRDGLKVVGSLGVCPETIWPYVESRFSSKPPADAYATALQDVARQYSRVAQALPQLKGCLAEGFPIVIGITIFQSFESQAVSENGLVPMPRTHESCLGGHAVLVVGYDDARQRFLVRNSWGPDWGDGGHFWIPYAYLLDAHLSDDFWTIRSIGAAQS